MNRRASDLLGDIYRQNGVEFSSTGTDLSDNNPYRRPELVAPPPTTTSIGPPPGPPPPAATGADGLKQPDLPVENV